ncbi:unnamed protein product [Brachionus calyciflorus]|uniref:C2H2-type domain-containing protein n=1 Tax=Brachionus calyciflorus TaxID=104777 RepID=A0A814HQ90_9BILA|nr:unnamed protein product [Brachionus calyciflorus]
MRSQSNYRNKHRYETRFQSRLNHQNSDSNNRNLAKKQIAIIFRSEYGSEFGDDNNEESNDVEVEIFSVDSVEEFNNLKNYESDEESCQHTETITIKESGFLANGTDSDNEENCESDFEEISSAVCKLSLNPTKKKLEKFSKIASEAPIASDATQSAVKTVLSKHSNPIACPECGKLMKNERGVKQHIAKMHK